jgi:NitT/TauT family transport system substrate-binding protein
MKQISKQSLKWPALVSIIILILAIVFGLLFYLNSQRGYTGKMESITIGKMPIESNALIYIAEDKGFFVQNGLNVTIRDYNTGSAAVSGLLNNEVDISGAGEYVVVGSAFNKKNISIIASIDKYQSLYLVGRKDRGIENVSDFKGKKIGVPQGTQAEFFLGRFLNLHGISLQNVTRVDVQPSQSVDAITNGSVDAVIYIRQYNDAIKDRLGDNGVFWPAQSSQLLYTVIVSRNDWVASHPETIRRFLKSLVQAEQYTIDHPAEVKAILQKRLNYEDAYIETVWKYNQFSLTLDQSLVLAMEDEARWMINNNLTSEKKTPDFLDYIYADGLEKIKPGSVNIIR